MPTRTASSLSEVRKELELFTLARLQRPLTRSDAERYAYLCDVERELLRRAGRGTRRSAVGLPYSTSGQILG